MAEHANAQTTLATAKGAQDSGDRIWLCTITSTAPLLGDTGTDLEIVVVDLDGDVRSSPADVDAWLPPVETANKDGSPGWKREGPVMLPAGITTPGAVLLRKLPGLTGSSVDFIGEVKLVSSDDVFVIPIGSWVASEHHWRVFFGGAAYLPKDTPEPLRFDRQRDLRELQGTPETLLQQRKGVDRIYWYQTYDDLGSKGAPRPNLGGSKQYPYPRRIASNRGSEPESGAEVPPPKGQDPWLPYDETFSYYKAKGFKGDTLASTLNAAFAIIAEAGDQKNLSFLNLVPTLVRGLLGGLLGLLPGAKQPIADFEDFADVLAMFKLAASETGAGFQGLLPKKLYPADTAMGMSAATTPGAVQPYKTADGAWDFRVSMEVQADLNRQTAERRVGPVYDSATGGSSAGVRRARPHSGAPPKPGATDVAERLGDSEWRRVKASSGNVNDLLYFDVPRVLEYRSDAWYTDEEYGRQMLSGYNPVVISALKELPEAIGSAVRGADVNGELQGATLEQLVAEAAAGGKPRLFMVSYWDLGPFWDSPETAEQDKKDGKVQHLARAFFYLRKNTAGTDDALIPVAIELAHPGTHKQFPELPATAGVVYARSALAHDQQTLAVWRLAKAVFKSVDFSYHELVSHFTRTHGALEPFLIALRRQMSTMHPVFKLMLPHFRYTLSINRNARTGLINAGGIIEQTFSAGEFAMRVASLVYANWTFAGQALPDDLRARGMLGPDGKPWTDYPFATDGLDIWNEINNYFGNYLRLYYKNDDDVVGDTELQAWWSEVKDEGHPDLVKFGLRTEEEVWGFVGPIPTISKLTHVLATIAWLASGHHAAVNFGQYDYTSFILNTSSLIRRAMPAPEDKEYKELTQAAAGSPQEKIIMTYLADPLSAVKVMATVQLLSTHAEDEQTLDEPNDLIVDPRAVAANLGFMAAMNKVQLTIQTRNANPAYWARFGLRPGTDSPLPYTLLMPGSGAGVTMRGVPYSVSI